MPRRRSARDVGNRKLGTLGEATATSFFPAKPLGCYGDGGAVFTDDERMRDRLASLRVHGQGTDKYDHVRIGLTARLDTIQAAILIEKLKIFPDEIERAQRIADRYSPRALVASQRCRGRSDSTSVVGAIHDPARARSAARFAAALSAQGIPTAIYYPKPLHRQAAYQRFPVPRAGCRCPSDWRKR